MRFSIRAIGKIKEKWMREGIEEYSKRLKPVAKVDVLESDEEKMPENPSAQAFAAADSRSHFSSARRPSKFCR